MGLHFGRTLPQIVFRDPDWFFWAREQRIFAWPQSHEAERIYRRATAIRVPNCEFGSVVVEYLVDRSSGRFAGMQLVRPGSGATNPNFPRHIIDLSVPRQLHKYDKTGMKIMIKDFKEIVFGDSKIKLTRRRAESFFDDDRNFVLTVDQRAG